MRAQVRPRLSKLAISTLSTPAYATKYQIDENMLGEWLEDEIAGPLKEKVKDHDINCVRSIYALRERTAPTRLEDAKAVFVTTNAALARSAYKYGKQIESSREISPVVTAYSLGNIAWLKRPLDAMDLPKKEMLSMAFAAMQPSEKLWAKFLQEIDRLKNEALIDPRIHSILRYDLRAREELMDLTQGSDSALGTSTITEIVSRVEAEIRGEETQKLEAERQAHSETAAVKKSHELRIKRFASNIGRLAGWIVLAALGGLATYAAIIATYFINEAIKWSWPLKYPTLLLTLLFVLACVLSLTFGFTLRPLRLSVERLITQRVVALLWGSDDEVK
jgi:hypothetical protein